MSLWRLAENLCEEISFLTDKRPYFQWISELKKYTDLSWLTKRLCPNNPKISWKISCQQCIQHSKPIEQHSFTKLPETCSEYIHSLQLGKIIYHKASLIIKCWLFHEFYWILKVKNRMTVQVQNGCGVSVVYPHDPVHDWEKVSYHILLARGKIKIQNLKCRFLFLLNAYHFCNIIQSNHLKNHPSCLPILGVR